MTLRGTRAYAVLLCQYTLDGLDSSHATHTYDGGIARRDESLSHIGTIRATFGIVLAGFFLEGCIAVHTTALAENQQLTSVEPAELSSRRQERLQQAGEEPVLLTAQTEAIFNRWLLQEATGTAYHDMFLRLAAMILLTTLPMLWVRQRRPS